MPCYQASIETSRSSNIFWSKNEDDAHHYADTDAEWSSDDPDPEITLVEVECPEGESQDDDLCPKCGEWFDECDCEHEKD